MANFGGTTSHATYNMHDKQFAYCKQQSWSEGLPRRHERLFCMISQEVGHSLLLCISTVACLSLDLNVDYG